MMEIIRFFVACLAVRKLYDEGLEFLCYACGTFYRIRKQRNYMEIRIRGQRAYMKNEMSKSIFPQKPFFPFPLSAREFSQINFHFFITCTLKLVSFKH